MPSTLPFSGIPDDDHPDDEQAGENEAFVRETDETTEAPEEFEIDDEDIVAEDDSDGDDDDEDDDVTDDEVDDEGEPGDTVDSYDEGHPTRLAHPRSLEEWRWHHP
jgi:hypothetical protein